jgi:hypothetical protein
MLRLPRRGRKARWAAILCGMAILLWLGVEDNYVWPVTLLGTGISALTIILWTLDRLCGKAIPGHYVPWLAVLMGALVGLGAALATVILMLFKNAWHSHIFLDFPAELMGAILLRAPLWALAGGMTGLGLGLAWLALHRRECDR